MTAYEVLTLADQLCPNVFSTGVKLFELNRMEQRIRVDVLGGDPAAFSPFTENDLESAGSVLASVSQREDDDADGSGDDSGEGSGSGSNSGDGSGETGEIETPGAGQETGEGDGEGSGGSGDDSGAGSGGENGTGENSDAGDEAGQTAPTGTLALEERYRDVYVFWLIAMYYYHMGEYEEYQNKKAMFDDAWIRFERDVCIERDKAAGYA